MPLVEKYGYDLDKVIAHQKELGNEAVVKVCLKAKDIESRKELCEGEINWLRLFWFRLLETAMMCNDTNKDGFVREDELVNLDAAYLDGNKAPEIPVQ